MAFCTERTDACDPACPGWVWSHSDTYGWNLERCDECARFVDDDQAAEHVARCLGCAVRLAHDAGVDCSAYDRAARAVERVWAVSPTPLAMLGVLPRRIARGRALARRARVLLQPACLDCGERGTHQCADGDPGCMHCDHCGAATVLDPRAEHAS